MGSAEPPMKRPDEESAPHASHGDPNRQGPHERLPIRAMAVAAAIACAVVVAGVFFLRALEPSPGPEINEAAAVLVDEGLSAYALGDLTGAQAAFAQARAADPQSALPVFNLGTIRDASGDTAGAQELYQRAIALDPEFANAHFNLAVAQVANGDLAGAEESYVRVMDLDPDRASAPWNLGLLLYADGRVDRARELLASAIALDAALASRLPEGVTLSP